jgi:hypothetical protein
MVSLRSFALANPPPVHDWHVPVALIDFQKLKDANWDITASKVCGSFYTLGSPRSEINDGD